MCVAISEIGRHIKGQTVRLVAHSKKVHIKAVCYFIVSFSAFI